MNTCVNTVRVNFLHFIILLLSLFATTISWAQVERNYTTYMRYNPAGQLTGTIKGDATVGYFATRNTYNATTGLLETVETGKLNLWQDENVAPSFWTSFSLISKQVYTYDTFGRKASVMQYDKNNTALSLTQTNYLNSYVQCVAVRMTPSNFNMALDACTPGLSSNLGEDRVTRYTRDNLGQVLTETRAGGTSLTQTYVTNTYLGAYPKTQTDANGNLTRIDYDPDWRVFKVNYPSPTTAGTVNESDYTSYLYDANGNKTYERKRSGAEITYGFDNNNRMTYKNMATNASDVCYGYDLRGLQLHARFQPGLPDVVGCAGQGITNTFDGFGRLKTSDNNQGGSRTITSFYDDNGNRTQIQHPDGSKFTYGFDTLNRVSGVSDNATASSNLLAVNYHNNGSRLNVTRTNGTTTTYEYNNGIQLNKITEAFPSNTTSNLVTDFTYNPAGQIRTLSKSNTSYTYTGDVNRTGNYTVNGLNQYTFVGGATQGTGQGIAYDTNGNLRNDAITTYTYDDENRLTFTAGTTPASSFVYDPNGRLFQATIGSTTRQFLYDGDALIGEYQNGTLIRRYVHGDQVDEPWVQYNSSSLAATERRYFHKDHQGSIIAHSNYLGTVLNSFAYDTFGIAATKNVDSFGYTGQIAFKELGINYYKARIYVPKLGRFAQTDPIGYKDDMDLYSYVGNDPVNKTDPTGLCAEAYCHQDWYPLRVANAIADTQRNNASNYTPQVINNIKEEHVEAAAATGAAVAGAAVMGGAVACGASVVCPAVMGAALTIGSRTQTIDVPWKNLPASSQNTVNQFMIQYGKGAEGAKGLLTALSTNGIPKGLNQQAFRAYQSQIKEVGGKKPGTSTSEVYQTRIKILDLILD